MRQGTVSRRYLFRAIPEGEVQDIKHGVSETSRFERLFY
jgi:hypothetical protein